MSTLALCTIVSLSDLGSYRYRRIRAAIEQDSAGPPMDMRYLKRTINKEPQATSECVSFLEGIYESVAETLPDVIDASMVTTLEETPGALSIGDAYSSSIGLESVERKRKGPRAMRKGLKVFRDRGKETRFLPPGRMKDYYEQLCSNFDGGVKKPPSFATFYRVALRSIGLWVS